MKKIIKMSKMVEKDIKRWLNLDGELFFKEMGIKAGQIVLDFGCGVSHYTMLC